MNPSVNRLIDANLNRAREALRVLEDAARFVLDDAERSAELKSLRHDLTELTREIAGDAIFSRATESDVGRSIKTDAEQTRADLNHVVIAAGKRLGEALRSIEEYLKTIDAHRAIAVEQLRYRFYEIEQKLAFAFRSTIDQFASVRLYVLITESACKQGWLDVAHAAIVGGADAIQLREKSLDGGELLRRAKAIVELCRAANVISIINDRPDIALLSGADGVHVGQDDLPAIEVRKLLGTGKIIGVSTHTIDQARQAQRDGADYIGVGPIFKSPTKPREIEPGLPFAREVAGEIKIPAVAIAGISMENIDSVLSSGLKSIAVTSAATSSDDVERATRELRKHLERDTKPGVRS